MIDVANILIVDDNASNIQVLGNLLRQNGYEVEFSLDGPGAVNWVQRKKFDLILLDVMMPQMDGYEVCSILKENPENMDIPIIFLTARNDEESILKGFNTGGIDYLTKPFNHKELLVRISTHIDLKKAKEKISIQNEEIIKSIESARYIQQALLPKNYITENSKNIFLINKPRDIVSGDFYWIKEVNNYLVFALADCTGHGVPGALMSMIGISGLNEIDFTKQPSPSDVLAVLRQKVKELLSIDNQDKNEGMDIGLCVFDRSSNVIQFSGALLNLYISGSDGLLELKGDRQPVASYPQENDFTTHTYKINTGDRVYMTSDGFTDQFGGEYGKKFKMKKFKESIISSAKLDINAQGKFIEHILDEWMKDYEQVDDILVIGIEF
ncbi:MAG: response regulator [Bacteroidales bacterium]|nr:response regulator [Bacteroidales bacterium]